MRSKKRFVLSFVPLLLAAAVLALLVGDLRQPKTLEDHCMVVAFGSDAERLASMQAFRQLYSHGQGVRYWMAMQCSMLGPVVMNDRDVPGLNAIAGVGATIERREYRFLPTQWRVSVRNLSGSDL